MGPNEDKQMEMLLEEGGIADDGMRVDPVSGNEIPPGSMASEVRDDVPAQLSEGEYVVPADVLRFYGVKFFEDLRAEAKMGLAGMEADGRIGGEPVPAGGPQMGGGGGEDLTPEEMAVLQEMGMAVGGMVPQPTQSTSPYMQQQQLYQQPSPVAMGNVGYAPGGLEDGSNVDPYTAQFTGQTSAAFGPGFLTDQTLGNLPTTGSDIRTVTMYGPNGEVETLTLPAQQARYDELLSMSYSETPVATTTDTTVGMVDEDDGGPFDDALGGQEAIANAEAQGLDTQSSIAANIANFGKEAVAGVINSSMLGLAVNAITGKTISEHLGITDDNGDSTGGIFGGLGEFSGDNQIGFADTALGDLLGFDGKLGVQGPSIAASIGGARRGGGNNDNQPTGGGKPQGAPQGQTPDTSTAAQEASDLGFGDVESGEFGGSSPDTSTAAQEASDLGFGDVESGEFG